MKRIKNIIYFSDETIRDQVLHILHFTSFRDEAKKWNKTPPKNGIRFENVERATEAKKTLKRLHF